MIGETIKDFKLIRRLGGGGMGDVWAAEQQLVQTRVAIKLLRAEISTDRQHVQRFFNEAVAAGKIKHAGIAKIFDVGFHAGRAFLIMELLEGETLAARIARAGKLPLREVADIGRQIASILEATHAAGIIHRDLKPENVFLTPDAELASKERVKVLDFGVAKLGTGVTTTGNAIGTPAYMAPELWTDAAKADGRADVYALGCLVFEMCRGKPPFAATWFGEAYAKHMNERPPPANTGSPQLDDLIARMLEKSPADRPAVRDIAAAFARVAADPTHTLEQPAPPARPRRKLGRAAIAGIAAAGVAAAGVTMLVATGGDVPSHDTAPGTPAPVQPTPLAQAVPPPSPDPPPPSDDRREGTAPVDEAAGGSTGGVGLQAAQLPASEPPRIEKPRPDSKPPTRPPAAAADERDPKALLRQGKAHERRGDWKAARETYEKLAKIRSHAGIALYLQARAALATDDTDAAIQLAFISAGHPGAHKTDAKFLYGDALYKQGELRRAKDIYLGLRKTLTGELKAVATRKIMAANRVLNLAEDDGLTDE